MNLFSPILRLFGLGGLSNKETGAQVASTGSASTDAGIVVTDQRALQVSAVWSCVQYITNAVASLPLEFYTKTEDGRDPLDPKHYLNQLFNNRPNAWMKPRDFRKALTMQLTTWANAYCQIEWNEKRTRPIALVPLRPGRTVPYIDPETSDLTYHYQTDQGVKVYPKESIMHLKGMGSDGIVGFDRMQFARKTLGLSVSADVYASKQFAHGGKSGGGKLFFDNWLTDEQRKKAKALYSDMNETAYKKGNMTILEGGLKYESDNINPDTMQMIQTRGFQLSEIARYFGVPDVLIGAASGNSAWPASFEQQLLFFMTFTLQDYLDEWEASIKDSLTVGSERQSIVVDHDSSGFIKMDSKSKAELQSKWVQNGLKSRNEVRRINNDPPSTDEGADALTVQVNLTPIGELEKVGVVSDQNTEA